MQRITQYLNYKGISKYKFCKTTGFSNGFLDKERSVGSDKCEIILYHYSDIKVEWLITGKGPMLRSSETRGQALTQSTPIYSKASEKSPTALAEPVLKYDKAKEKKDSILSACDEKERIIQSLEHQIKDLKNNLERVISSKDELLVMKDQAIKNHLEKIKQQSARLSELEDYKSAEEAKKTSTYDPVPGTGMPDEDAASSDDVTRPVPRPYGRAGKRPPA